MDFHGSLKLAGGLMALLLFIPLVAGILKSGTEGQSCATWLLWGLLDTVLTISLLAQHGNFWLPLGFAIGDLFLVVLLLVKRQFRWGWFETAIFGLVIACLLAWKVSGPRTATIASTLGVCFAGIPGLLAMWKQLQRNIG